jgi:hypothetical protein
MGHWGEPFLQDMIYNIGDGKTIRVRKALIDHFPTIPFSKGRSKEVPDERVLLGVEVDGDISKEDAVAVREWILGGLKRESTPEFLVRRIGWDTKPKGERDMGEKIELGCKVKDSVTGYVGKVTARCQYLDGPSQVLAEGIDSTGRPISYWIIEGRAEVQG